VKTTVAWQDLSDPETETFRSGKCPDCGTGLVVGPSGGLSQNMYCGNDETCGSRFNEMGPFGVQRITDASPKKPVANA
jgi:hypothetical protein